jgi:hypothetical protein
MAAPTQKVAQNAPNAQIGAFWKGRRTMFEVIQHGKVLATCKTRDEAYIFIEQVTGRTVSLAILRDGFMIKRAGQTDKAGSRSV